MVAGKYFSMALTSSHQVLAWGNNASGDLGNGTNGNSLVPTFVDLPGSIQVHAIGSGFGSGTAMAIGKFPPV